MIRYLQDFDYAIVVQLKYLLNDLIQKDHRLLVRAENTAIDEINSYLVQRYDTTEEFTNTAPYSSTTIYHASDRVILDFATFSSNTNYHMGDCLIDATNKAWCLTGTTSVSATASFDPTYFSNLGQQYDMFYAQYPAPYFDYRNFYNEGNIVYWQGFTWSAAQDTPTLNQTDKEQYINISAIPTNVIPTDLNRNANQAYWISSGITYSIPVGTLPTNTTYFTAGDNRSNILMVHMINMVLFYLHKSIAPTNVPKHREDGYYDAINYLKSLSLGRKNSSILILQPEEDGLLFRYGSQVRRNQAW